MAKQHNSRLEKEGKKQSLQASSIGNKKQATKFRSAANGKHHNAVQVVVAPTGFPISSRGRSNNGSGPNRQQLRQEQQQQQQQQQEHHKQNKPQQQQQRPIMDLNQAKKEVRQYGATAFEGAQKRSFEEEQYQLLTGGRARKKPFVPPNIARNSRKKAEQRHLKALREAQASGVVLPTTTTRTATKQHNSQKRRQEEYQRDRSSYGPAPSSAAGVVRNGILHFSKKPF
ncbi:hypothetical protein ACA910_018740 [Epithemia clementina (nom. ined.)]